MPLPFAPVLALLLAASPAPAPKPAPPPLPAKPAVSTTAATAATSAAPGGAQTTLKDRVVAIVDEDPILASDVDRVIGLGLAQRNPGESDHDFHRRVLGQLIDQRLRFHEIDRFGFVQVPVARVDQQVQEIRSRFKSDAELAQRLKEVGLSPAGLRQLASRQLMVLTYVDERLGPRVFVSPEDINAYYRDVLVPDLKKRNLPVPPVEQVREEIRGVLKEQRLNQEIDSWTDELRRKADILNYFDDQGKALPPVVKTIGKAKPG